MFRCFRNWMTFYLNFGKTFFNRSKFGISWRTTDGEQKIVLMQLQVYNYRPQRSCGKVIFIHLSVILFTGGVWQTPLYREDTPWTDTPLDTPPLPSRRYASYWNAFLFFMQTFIFQQRDRSWGYSYILPLLDTRYDAHLAKLDLVQVKQFFQ